MEQLATAAHPRIITSEKGGNDGRNKMYLRRLRVRGRTAEYLNDGWNVLDMKTTLYDSTAGIRRDTTVYLIKTDQNIELTELA